MAALKKLEEEEERVRQEEERLRKEKERRLEWRRKHATKKDNTEEDHVSFEEFLNDPQHLQVSPPSFTR